MIEQHYRINEIAAKLGVSHQTATRMFENIPGVRTEGNQTSTKHKKKYRTIMVPESVLETHLRHLE